MILQNTCPPHVINILVNNLRRVDARVPPNSVGGTWWSRAAQAAGSGMVEVLTTDWDTHLMSETGGLSVTDSW